MFQSLIQGYMQRTIANNNKRYLKRLVEKTPQVTFGVNFFFLLKSV